MKVRLSSNESPFGPSPAAVEAATQAVREAHLYPDDQSIALREAIAGFEGRPVGEVAVGTGSAALLLDIVAHLAEPDDEVLAFDHSFVMTRLGARNVGARYIEVPDSGPATHDGPGYVRDVDRLLDAVTDATRVVYIDNPGNPTNAHLAGDDLRALAERLPERVTLVVDEAYHQFAIGQQGYATVAELGIEGPRVLVTRTFSKAYALAGQRVGYVLGDASVIEPLDGRRTRFNVSSSAQRAAIAALADTEHLRRTVDGTLEGRTRMAAALREMGIPFTDGLGNFLTIELGTPAPAIVDAYASHGIGVREVVPYGMQDQLRVSVGTPDEVDAFLEASEQVLATVPSRG